MKGLIELPFVKMHGIGNDYIYIDALNGEIPFYLEDGFLPDLSMKISDRHFGIGSDGLILILPSEQADFQMRIFNSDGSEAKMCGNGIRCVGKYVYDFGFTSNTSITIETNSGLKHLELIKGENGVENVIVDMGSPLFKRMDIPSNGNMDSEMNDIILQADKKEFKVTGVSMGNPHGVVYVEDLENLDLAYYGPLLENHSVWIDRANIEFVEPLNRNEIKVRVWERGSGETLACGTGACAAVVTSCRKGLTDSKVLVHLRGGNLEINYNRLLNRVKMSGPATFVAKGVFYYNPQKIRIEDGKS